MADEQPGVLRLDDYSGEWAQYEEELYRIYTYRVVRGGLTFQGRRIQCTRHPEVSGKAFGFWHLVTEGEVEEQRTPDMRRCERLPWIPWVIRQASESDGRTGPVLWWVNKRRSGEGYVLWFREEEYIVVLSIRPGYLLLKTAFLHEPHRARTYQREWESYWAAQND
ncbi:MAG TPA: hypothetical protein VK610_06625 [Rhodothermales bacterium]|nr:hypothetical protein [Rhodothermales bacterium]